MVYFSDSNSHRLPVLPNNRQIGPTPNGDADLEIETQTEWRGKRKINEEDWEVQRYHMYLYQVLIIINTVPIFLSYDYRNCVSARRIESSGSRAALLSDERLARSNSLHLCSQRTFPPRTGVKGKWCSDGVMDHVGIIPCNDEALLPSHIRQKLLLPRIRDVPSFLHFRFCC